MALGRQETDIERERVKADEQEAQFRVPCQKCMRAYHNRGVALVVGEAIRRRVEKGVEGDWREG